MVLPMKHNIAQARTTTLYKVLWFAIKKKGYPMAEKDLAMAVRKLINTPDMFFNFNLFADKSHLMSDGYYMLQLFSWSSAPQGHDFWWQLHRGLLKDAL